MKVVGLLSGGKDSCFNLCHCVKQGHELVALASLRPEGGKEEIDSYLYQTVGQDGLHFIAEALELPLYRRTIHGTAVDQGSDYASTSQGRARGHIEGDETEDLYDLLQQVLVAHPDVQGVSVGAILSNYQRVRVEHVCARLGLQSLSYLWQYDQTTLLEDMADAGMECIIIKVAGAGLGLRHLGQNVCSPDMRSTLAALKEKWGTHPAGEGGEYETFTLNCPLFKKRIELYDMGTIAYLRLQDARLVAPDSPLKPLTHLHVPELLDEESQALYESLQKINPPTQDQDKDDTLSRAESPASRVNVCSLGPWTAVGNISARGKTAEEQVQRCFETVEERLKELDLDFLSLAHIDLYLSSMDLFPSVNAVYNTYFGPSPPTRACVACPLPSGSHVKMDILAYRVQVAHERSALHVRGLSYWAPANIGPYSQAVRVGEKLFVAGQIGLIPATLALPQPPSFALEAALSSQHARRIVKAMQEGTGGGFSGRMDSCVCWLSGPSASFSAKVRAAKAAWQACNLNTPIRGSSPAPILFVQVPSLPKNAQIEWQITWNTHNPEDEDEDDDGTFSRQNLPQQATVTQDRETTSDTLTIGSSTTTMVTLADAASVVRDARREALPARILAVRAFHLSSIPGDLALSRSIELFGEKPAVTTIPVCNLASMKEEQVEVAILAFGNNNC